MSSDISAVSIVLVLVGISAVAITLYLVPRFMRPDIYFAVTVLPDFPKSLDGRVVLGQYRVRIVIHYVIALGLAVLFLRFHPGLAPLLGMVWLIVGSLSAYRRARTQVMPHAAAPTTVREAELRPREFRLPGGWLGQLGPFAILAAAGLYLHTHWAEIPARFPTHWDVNGQPDGWGVRTFWGVYQPLLTALVICGFLVLVAWCILYFTRRVPGSRASDEKAKRIELAHLSIILGCEYFLLSLTCWILFFRVRHEQGTPNVLLHVSLSLGIAVVATLLAYRAGRRGLRAGDTARDGEDSEMKGPPVGDRTPDRCWKAGIIYVNPDDPALLVHKRSGLGWTLNFGRSGTWLILALLVIFLLASRFIPK